MISSVQTKSVRCKDCGEVFPVYTTTGGYINTSKSNGKCPKCGSKKYRYDIKENIKSIFKIPIIH